jgi:hypothetical protein
MTPLLGLFGVCRPECFSTMGNPFDVVKTGMQELEVNTEYADLLQTE